MNVKNSAAGEFKRSPAPIEAGVQGVPQAPRRCCRPFPEPIKTCRGRFRMISLLRFGAGVQGVPQAPRRRCRPLFRNQTRTCRGRFRMISLLRFGAGVQGVPSGTQAALPPLSGADEDLLREIPDDPLLRSERACRVCLRHPGGAAAPFRNRQGPAAGGSGRSPAPVGAGVQGVPSGTLLIQHSRKKFLKLS